MKKITTIKKRARKHEEVAPRYIAIRNHCLECSGYSAKDVQECPSMDCWLYPYRLGNKDNSTQGQD